MVTQTCLCDDTKWPYPITINIGTHAIHPIFMPASLPFASPPSYHLRHHAMCLTMLFIGQTSHSSMLISIPSRLYVRLWTFCLILSG
ncbi:hypothetical protein AG1IA_09405 [Rhizoctonia solani AG-1 IA]|uniref:Uncharacterized protein n=1 Tax=Thanatephorus cucumeris (strain AG1-IA) TaxID=983506 RepID=L8WJM2_THACA|nr:hypothetical protein AG1IA_09405 [Rhizoctonia solani AG-1 IA]